MREPLYLKHNYAHTIYTDSKAIKTNTLVAVNSYVLKKDFISELSSKTKKELTIYTDVAPSREKSLEGHTERETILNILAKVKSSKGVGLDLATKAVDFALVQRL